jgi:hypothetical protein
MAGCTFGTSNGRQSVNIYEINKIENNEMGGACSSDGRGKRIVQCFWWGNPREGEH